MRLFTINYGANMNIILNFLIGYIKKLLKVNQKDLESIKKLYSEEEIEHAINSLYVIGKSVYAPTSGKDGVILRYLEYGGYGIKTKKILSRASRLISRKVNGDEYVF